MQSLAMLDAVREKTVYLPESDRLGAMRPHDELVAEAAAIGYPIA